MLARRDLILISEAILDELLIRVVVVVAKSMLSHR